MAHTWRPPPFMLPHDLFRCAKLKTREIKLSDFDMISELGTGGCGTVAMVRHRSTSKLYALKIGLESDAQTAAEAKILRHCAESPFIVRCHSVLHTNSGNMALLLELMNAGSLHSIYSRSRSRFSEPALAHIAVQTLAGLAFMHHRHIVHLDVKPANILANANGTVKICDLGFAKMLDPHAGIRPSFSAGTLAYFSPERFFFDPYRHCDAYAADIWSLGISLLELFLGCYPMLNPGQDSSQDRLIDTICFGSTPLPPEGMASENFRAFLDLCLQKDPKKRPSALELLKHPFITRRPKALSCYALCELTRNSHCKESQKPLRLKQIPPIGTTVVARNKGPQPGFEHMTPVWHPKQPAIARQEGPPPGFEHITPAWHPMQPVVARHGGPPPGFEHVTPGWHPKQPAIARCKGPPPGFEHITPTWHPKQHAISRHKGGPAGFEHVTPTWRPKQPTVARHEGPPPGFEHITPGWHPKQPAIARCKGPPPGFEHITPTWHPTQLAAPTKVF